MNQRGGMPPVQRGEDCAMTCALCHQERVRANLIQLPGGEWACPACLYELALRAMAKKGVSA